MSQHAGLLVMNILKKHISNLKTEVTECQQKAKKKKIEVWYFIFRKELAAEGIDSRIIWTKFKEIYFLLL
jgi:hypothetical protein